VVVAIWAVLNGLLAAMLAGFGENYFALQLYGSAAPLFSHNVASAERLHGYAHDSGDC
jgi:hypothetical protein